MDREVWQTTVHAVVKIGTQLSTHTSLFVSWGKEKFYIKEIGSSFSKLFTIFFLCSKRKGKEELNYAFIF